METEIHPHSVSDRLHSSALLVQGLYWFSAGIWPLLHVRSFLAVTGCKHDTWLVQTLGALIAVIGAALLIAWRVRSRAHETTFLAIASAAALMLIDIIFVFNQTISPIYMRDAMLELALILLWSAALITSARISPEQARDQHLARRALM